MFSSRAAWWPVALAVTFLATFVVGQSDLGSVAASIAVAAAAVLIGCGGTAWPGIATRSATQRPFVSERRHRAVLIPQCDPDAAGRPRPRAPGRLAHR